MGRHIKRRESVFDFQIFNVWWQYLIRTPAFHWLESHKISAGGLDQVWDHSPQEFRDFATGYGSRGWFTYILNRGKVVRLERDPGPTWDRWQAAADSDRRYLEDTDGTLGEKAIRDFILHVATSGVDRVEQVEERFGGRLTTAERRRVAARHAARLMDDFKNRLFLCVDPYSQSADDLKNAFAELLNEKQMAADRSPPDRNFDHLPQGGCGCRYRCPTPGRKPDLDTLKRRLTLYCLAELNCLAGEEEGERRAYRSMIDGSFLASPGEAVGLPSCYLPFGDGPQSDSDLEKDLWLRRDLVQQGRAKPNEIIAEDRVKKENSLSAWIGNEVRAAEATLQCVSAGWFPKPPE